MKKKGKPKSTNIKDVARMAGVSAQTVSNYLNKKAIVSDAKIIRIRKAIEELDYHPNIFARSLSSGNSKIIGVLIPELGNPFYSPIIDGIEEVASLNGYSIILERNNYDRTRLLNDLRSMTNYVDGIIICTSIAIEEEVLKIIKSGFPVVMLDSKSNDNLIPSVEVDNFKSAYTGTEYLINMGHKNIYYISEPLVLNTTKDRWLGFLDCLKNNNIELDESKVIIDEKLNIEKAQGGILVMNEILKDIKLPAAVFATSDLIILGAMKSTIQMGYQIPADISF